MKKENSIFTKLVKNKRILFLTIIVLIAVFAMIINYAYASFISGNTDELLNTQVSELKYAYAINEKADSILYLRPNEEKAFDLIIKSLEEIDTKYEIIYEKCTDRICNRFEETKENIEVYKSTLSENEVSGVISAEGVKRIRLVAINNSNEEAYLKFKINPGFVHNTLTLKKDITSEYEDDFLLTSIILNSGGYEQIKEPEINIYNEISTESENNLYKTNDDMGISYYFRGANEHLNNNLILDNHYFKIVRINGDESIRLIYNGTCTSEDCLEISNEITSPFNLYNENGYLVDHEEETKNSLAKDVLETWYEENIISADFENLIYDTDFCNDNEYTEDETIIFNSYTRLKTNKTPTLKCSSPLNVKNENLKYPVGLLTSDEASFAGLKYNTDSVSNYLNASYNWWTMTPYSYENETYKMFYVNQNGSLIDIQTDFVNYLRPVINLKPGTKVSGTGTLLDPYHVNN